MGERILPEGYQGEGKGAPEFEVKRLAEDGVDVESKGESDRRAEAASKPIIVIDRLTGKPIGEE